ncbi:MAG: hypothetical protein GY702_16180 [Desulfobulbaceae bacterium]|nr:hypothetical protein [Desulfobulbaceae bacterium]
MTQTNKESQKIADSGQMKSCAKDLNSLGPDTEPEFLKIGETLNQLATICFGMTDKALQLTVRSNFRDDDNENGSNHGSVIEETRGIFDEVALKIKDTLDSLLDGEHLLNELLLQVKKLQLPIEQLFTIGKTFRVLAIAIKVESSRNTSATGGFQLLASEVADIASLVQQNCHNCSDKTNTIQRDICSSKNVLNSSETRYDDQSETSLFNILSALEEVGSKAEMLASEIKERSTLMSQGIGDVVMAMQFHDISRQQLENVAHALRETSEKTEFVSVESSYEEQEEIALEVYGILSIQVAHLNSIFEQIYLAKKQIETGLQKTMDQARQQAKDAGTLLGMEGRMGSKSVIVNLESEIDNIVVSLNKSLAVVEQAAEVSKGVNDNVSEIGEFVSKIEEIAFDVKVLAINAMVEAIKTGSSGNTLTVLARELSTLSQETRDGASVSIDILQSIMEGAERQMQFSENLNQESNAIDAIIGRAKILTATILATMQEVSNIAQKIDKENRELSTRITKLIPSITFPKVMGDRIDRNWQVICQTINQLETDFPQLFENNSKVEKMMEKLKQKYVMERERSIHAEVTGKKAEGNNDAGIDLFEDDGFELFDDDPEKPQKKEKARESEDDFDDNIELF